MSYILCSTCNAPETEKNEIASLTFSTTSGKCYECEKEGDNIINEGYSSRYCLNCYIDIKCTKCGQIKDNDGNFISNEINHQGLHLSCLHCDACGIEVAILSNLYNDYSKCISCATCVRCMGKFTTDYKPICGQCATCNVCDCGKSLTAVINVCLRICIDCKIEKK